MRDRATERNMIFSISSREDWKSASSATVETSAEADSVCDSADEESCRSEKCLNFVCVFVCVYCVCVCVCVCVYVCVCVCECEREREREMILMRVGVL